MPDFAKALRHLRPREKQQRLLPIDNPVSSLARQLSFLKAHSPFRRVEHASIEGEEETTALGRHLVIRSAYDDDHYHGKVRLGRFSVADLQRFMTLTKQKGSVEDRNSIVFLDTETTGIQGGTGMVPFLVGLCYFDGDSFRSVQYFIRDFDEEHSMLLALGDFLQRFRLVVTYNGSSFDLPLLETRFTLARLNSPFENMSHLDLLPGARKLWRHGHGSCRLVALEQKIVMFHRGEDIPGSMIPKTYFDFLEGRGTAAMASVLKHNLHDIVSLAALTVSACDRVNAEPAAFEDPLDLYSLARIMEHTPEWRRALEFYERAIQGGLPDAFLAKAQENLVVLSRRAGDHPRAIELCRELMTRTPFSMVAHEGAAIHYERIMSDPLQALQVVESALARLADSAGHKHWQALLQSRRERLRQKAIQFS